MQKKANKLSQQLQQPEESKLYEAPEVNEDHRQKFSSGKIGKFMKNGRFCERIGAGAPVFMSAVLEYLTGEIVELAEHQLKAEQKGKGKGKKMRITPRHIMLAIRSDPELAELFHNANFCGAGTVPTAVAKPAGEKKAKKMVDTESEDDEEFKD